MTRPNYQPGIRVRLNGKNPRFPAGALGVLQNRGRAPKDDKYGWWWYVRLDGGPVADVWEHQFDRWYDPEDPT